MVGVIEIINVLSFVFSKVITYVSPTAVYDTTYILNYVRDRGYPVEVHDVKTKDGFILNIHRIPQGNNNNSGRGVVLLAHGLQESSEHWIINGDKSLGLLLPNLGYDVWLTNARGSHHSKDHVKFQTGDPDYWNFSWHEIGVYDLPVTIDYILASTGVSNISYIGHSQGATSFFVLTTQKPQYNDKFNIMVALAPAVYMSHVRNPLFRILSNIWEMIYPNTGLLDNAFLNKILENFCKHKQLIRGVCTHALFITGGYDYEQLDEKIYPEILRSFPAGSSTKQLLHYVQLVKSGDFRKYDYTSSQNLRVYGTSFPTEYDLSKVTANIALYYSKNDWLSDPIDVKKLRDKLINADIVVDHLINYESFTHFDFLFAKDVVPLLYKDVIDTLNSFN